MVGSLASVLPVTQRSLQVVHSKVLYEWGLSMMRDALLTGNPDARRCDYRNGLMIALFAARAPRVRSMASLRLGTSVIRHGDTWRLIFASDDVKTRRRIAYDLPSGLNGAMERYIAVEREELLAGQTHDWFWVEPIWRTSDGWLHSNDGPDPLQQRRLVHPSGRIDSATRWERPRR